MMSCAIGAVAVPKHKLPNRGSLIARAEAKRLVAYMYGHVFAASGGAGPRPAAASQAACTGRAEGPPQRRALPHIALEYVAGFLKTKHLG
jgi:hypothetical protein